MEPSERDGRVLRRMRNRDAILDALLELYGEGRLLPTVREVAERAGLTARSVHQHFRDLENLVMALAERHAREYRRLYKPAPVRGRLPERAEALVEQRAALFEATGWLRRGARLLEHRARPLRHERETLEALLRRQVEAAFADELRGLAGKERQELLEGLDLLASFETWERLRDRQRLDAERARRVLTKLLLSCALT